MLITRTVAVWATIGAFVLGAFAGAPLTGPILGLFPAAQAAARPEPSRPATAAEWTGGLTRVQCAAGDGTAPDDTAPALTLASGPGGS